MGVWVPVVAGDRGAWTILDEDVADLLAGRSLSLGSHGYAQTYLGGRVEVVHRIVMGCVPRDGRIVDHVDGDQLNNLRTNLRLVTAAENTQNRRQARPNRGAHLNRHGRWSAVVHHNGKAIRLGTFAKAEEAAAVAKEYRMQHFSSCAT